MTRTGGSASASWSVDDQLIEPGLIAVAAPLRDPAGTPVCALSVVSHTSRHSAKSLREAVLARLHAAAAVMEAELARDHTPAFGTAPARPHALAAWTSASKRELGSEFVESLARGLTVLTAFGTDRAELTLSAVAEATGLARATARRALITLDHLGLVATEGRAFRPTPRVLALGCPSCAPPPRPSRPTCTWSAASAARRCRNRRPSEPVPAPVRAVPEPLRAVRAPRTGTPYGPYRCPSEDRHRGGPVIRTGTDLSPGLRTFSL